MDTGDIEATLQILPRKPLPIPLEAASITTSILWTVWCSNVTRIHACRTGAPKRTKWFGDDDDGEWWCDDDDDDGDDVDNDDGILIEITSMRDDATETMLELAFSGGLDTL